MEISVSRLPGLPNVNRKILIFLVVGVLLGSVSSYLVLESENVDGMAAATQLERTLEAQSGQQLEIVNVKDQNSMYKVDLKDQQNQLTTYYITKNGQLTVRSDSVSNLNQLTLTVVAQQQFTNCLASKNVTLYGNASQRATAVQMQALGGQHLASPIYRDVNSQGILQQAVERGVQNVPSFYYDESVLSGLNNVNQISQFTGCQYGSFQ